jgi:hypothetical protein
MLTRWGKKQSKIVINKNGTDAVQRLTMSPWCHDESMPVFKGKQPKIPIRDFKT